VTVVGVQHAVPAGKRLIVRNISVNGDQQSGNLRAARLFGTVGGHTSENYYALQPTYIATGSWIGFVVDQPMTLVVDSGTLNLQIYRDATSGAGYGTFTITGDLVDCNTLISATVTAACTAST
jgi:hypothetical protein